MNGQGDEVFSRTGDVTWRQADGVMYVFDTRGRRAFRLDNAGIAEAGAEELRRVFGDSDTNVIRVCNMI